MSAEHLKIPVRVSEVAAVNALVTRFSFSAISGAELPTFSGARSPATTAGNPGSKARTAQPCAPSAAGSAPATSARPPVLSKGNSSALTWRMRMCKTPDGAIRKASMRRA